MTFLSMTKEQARILDNIARKHKSSPVSVAMLASAFGPQMWRDCILGIQVFTPKQGIDWAARERI